MILSKIARLKCFSVDRMTLYGWIRRGCPVSIHPDPGSRHNSISMRY